MTSEEITLEIESLRAEAQRCVVDPATRQVAREYLAQVPLWEIALQLAQMNKEDAELAQRCVNMEERVFSLENSRTRITQRLNRERNERLGHTQPGKKERLSEPCETGTHKIDGGSFCSICGWSLQEIVKIPWKPEDLDRARPGKTDAEASPVSELVSSANLWHELYDAATALGSLYPGTSYKRDRLWEAVQAIRNANEAVRPQAGQPCKMGDHMFATATPRINDRCGLCGFTVEDIWNLQSQGSQVPEPSSTTNPSPIEKSEPETEYPYVAKYGSRWGLWRQAGFPARTFDSRGEALREMNMQAEPEL